MPNRDNWWRKWLKDTKHNSDIWSLSAKEVKNDRSRERKKSYGNNARRRWHRKTKNNNKKDGIVMERITRIEAKGKNPSAIEIIQKKNLDIIDKVKEKGMIRKGIVKDMLGKIERQNDVKIEAIRKKLDIKEELEKERQRSTLVELVNKGWTNNSPRNNDSLKEKIDKRLKSIEKSMILPKMIVWQN